MILIGEERLGRMTGRHEMAHALDHVLGRLNDCGWISKPLLITCSGRADYISQYAKTNNMEYFAESCEAWVTGGFGREKLRRCDPAMHQWLTTLFARFDVY
jgi:hypothetical protein